MARPLRVGLVGYVAGGYSGVPRYAAALASALDGVAGEFPQLELKLATTRRGAANVGATRLQVVTLPGESRRLNEGPGRIAVEQLASRVLRADLLHYFDLTGPVLAPRRAFTATVHDVSVLHGLRPRKHEYKRRLWPWAAKRARKLVAISAYAGDEAALALGVPADRLAVIHSGPGFTPHGDGAVAAPPANGPYLLYVGALAASKNLPFLVDAFDRSEAEASLVLAGRPGDGYEELRSAIDRARRRERVVLLDEVSDDQLDGLYRGALALAHPSRYEGFGFTPLEAMARGCPVLASDIPALREVAGDGAELLPVDRPEPWVKALERAAADEGWRAELRARGLERVGRYSWQETARALCRLFLEVGRPAGA